MIAGAKFRWATACLSRSSAHKSGNCDQAMVSGGSAQWSDRRAVGRTSLVRRPKLEFGGMAKFMGLAPAVAPPVALNTTSVMARALLGN